MDQDEIAHEVIGKIEGLELTTSTGSRLFVGHSNLNQDVFLQAINTDGHVTRLQLRRETAALLGKLLAGEASEPEASPMEMQHILTEKRPTFHWKLYCPDMEGHVKEEPNKPPPDPTKPWRNFIEDAEPVVSPDPAPSS
jgi:hypothetical protein